MHFSFIPKTLWFWYKNVVKRRTEQGQNAESATIEILQAVLPKLCIDFDSLNNLLESCQKIELKTKLKSNEYA